MSKEQFLRTQMLLGEQAVDKLQRSTVALFGLGGVGGAAAEALARAGPGRFILVDNDTVDITNLNRQVIATHETVGLPKVEVMKSRILSINPDAAVETHQVFLLDQPEFIKSCDYIVDAVDTVTAKINLALFADERSIPIISAMGTGNKLNAAQFEVADIYQTSVCPLCRVMRRELKKRGVKRLKVVYSKELPRSVNGRIPGSMPNVPPVAGMILAGEVIRDLALL